jgi:hypothetical protein
MKSYVYAILDSKNNCLKIGKANDVTLRMVDIQIGNPTELKLIATIPCFSENHAFAVESELHRKYSNLYVRGEWFKYDDSILKEFVSFIDNNQNKKTRDALITNTLWEDHQEKFDVDSFPRCYFYPDRPAHIMGQYEKVQSLKIKWRTMEYPTFGKQMLILPNGILASDKVNLVFISAKKHEENMKLKRFYKEKNESISFLKESYE